MVGDVLLERSYYICRNCGYKEIPLDEALEITGLPHKITTRCQMDIAYWGQNQPSFREAHDAIKKTKGMEINEETLRQVTEAVGNAIFQKDTLRSKNSMENAAQLEVADNPKKTTLYIMTDGAAVNTRVEDENGSTWRENKTIMVFKDKDIIRRKEGSPIIRYREETRRRLKGAAFPKGMY